MIKSLPPFNGAHPRGNRGIDFTCLCLTIHVIIKYHINRLQSKVNYNKFLQIIKVNNSEYSNCDNYFCAFIEYKNLCFSNNKFTNLELYSEIFNRVRNIDFSTFTNETILDKGCKLLYYNLPSLDWINSQIIYINSLDNLSKKIINLYTFIT